MKLKPYFYDPHFQGKIDNLLNDLFPWLSAQLDINIDQRSKSDTGVDIDITSNGVGEFTVVVTIGCLTLGRYLTFHTHDLDVYQSDITTPHMAVEVMTGFPTLVRAINWDPHTVEPLREIFRETMRDALLAAVSELTVVDE